MFLEMSACFVIWAGKEKQALWMYVGSLARITYATKSSQNYRHTWELFGSGKRPVDARTARVHADQHRTSGMMRVHPYVSADRDGRPGKVFSVLVSLIRRDEWNNHKDWDARRVSLRIVLVFRFQLVHLSQAGAPVDRGAGQKTSVPAVLLTPSRVLVHPGSTRPEHTDLILCNSRAGRNMSLRAENERKLWSH